jgi:hypothetical protein
MVGILALLPASKRYYRAGASPGFAQSSATTGFCAPCMLALIAGTDAAVPAAPAPSAPASGPSALTIVGIAGAVGLVGFLAYGALNPPRSNEFDRPGHVRAMRNSFDR